MSTRRFVSDVRGVIRRIAIIITFFEKHIVL